MPFPPSGEEHGHMENWRREEWLDVGALEHPPRGMTPVRVVWESPEPPGSGFRHGGVVRERSPWEVGSVGSGAAAGATEIGP